MTRRAARDPRGGTLVWFRRDLRDFDHAALAIALRSEGPVFAAFVFVVVCAVSAKEIE